MRASPLASLLFLGIILAAPAAAAPKQAPAADPAALRMAVDRGRLLFAYDQAAWHATDDMLAKLPDGAAKVGGWIVDGPAEAPEIVFYDKDEVQPHALFVASFSKGKLASSHVVDAAGDRAITGARLALITATRAARNAFVAAKVKRCASKPFNTAVLPPETAGGPTRVYFLTPQTKANSYPMGGHYVVEVDAGNKVSAPKPFTRSCLEMTAPRKKDGEPVAMVVTHLLDPIPTEIHVFSSFTAGVPVVVITTENRRTWMVSGPEIVEMPGLGG